MVKWSHECGSWTFLCDYGCFEMDFEGEQEAREKFLSHHCMSSSEPCS